MSFLEIRLEGRGHKTESERTVFACYSGLQNNRNDALLVDLRKMTGGPWKTSSRTRTWPTPESAGICFGCGRTEQHRDRQYGVFSASGVRKQRIRCR